MNSLIGGRYQIINRLGQGGFGETFLAKDTHLPSQRLTVIKRLHQLESQDKASLELVSKLFKKEAEVLERLGHNCPQIPTLYAYFVEDDQFYLVQEYVQGKSLADLGQISVEEAQRILTSLLKTLQYIHSQKIIHRDLKPENIIIRHDTGEPVLIDFGAVKETMATIVLSSDSIASSVVVGTKGFMPPEQSMGRTVYASDLFALGLTIIYCLTRKYPIEFPCDSVTGELQWQKYVPQLDRSLQSVLETAIKMDLNKRYSTAESMYQDLFLSDIKTVAVVPNRSFQSIGDKTTSHSTKVAGISATVDEQNTVSNSDDEDNSDAPSSIVNQNQKKPNWLMILLITLLVGIGVSSFVMVRKYVVDTQAKLAQQEQERLEVEARIEEERQKRLEEERKRLDLEQSMREAEEKRLEEARKEEERRKEAERIAEEKRLEEQRRKEQEEREKEKEKDPDDKENPIKINPPINKTIDIVQDLYRFVNSRQYDRAKSLFVDPEKLNADFFNKFDRVTVENLRIIENTENYVLLKGINKYYYPDGSVQTESRSYTLEIVDNNWKITESDFIKVIKLRG